MQKDNGINPGIVITLAYTTDGKKIKNIPPKGIVSNKLKTPFMTLEKLAAMEQTGDVLLIGKAVTTSKLLTKAVDFAKQNDMTEMPINGIKEFFAEDLEM